MTIFEIQLIRDKDAKDAKVEQEIYAVEDDTIGSLLKHLDTEIRSSKVKIVAIILRHKVTKYIQ